jgi:hypothetical protein
LPANCGGCRDESRDQPQKIYYYIENRKPTEIGSLYHNFAVSILAAVAAFAATTAVLEYTLSRKKMLKSGRKSSSTGL